MALVTCPDCKTEISDAAPNCPKCGRPMAAGAAAKKKSANARLFAGLALIGLGAILYFMGGDLYLTMGGVAAGIAGLVVLLLPSSSK